MKIHARLSGLAVVVLMASGLLFPSAALMQQNAYPPFEQFASGRILNRNSVFDKQNAEVMFGKDPPDDKWQGFMQFDLSGIPDNAYVTSVSVVYEVISASDPGPWTVVRLLSLDPATADAAALWGDIVSGTVVTDVPVQEVRGWVERPLNAAGVAAVQAALSQDRVAFGLHKYDETEAKGHVKGYQAGPHKPYLKISFAGRDLGVVRINEPVGNVPFNSFVQPSVTVSNHGDVDGPFRLTFDIIDGSTVVYHQELELAGLAPGETAGYVFPRWQTVGSGERVARARVYAEGDADPDNDMAVEWFDILGENQPGPLVWGWEETRSVPAGASGKPVRQGGWLAADPVTGLIYSGKGNKTGDFAVFDPIDRRWTELASIPAGPGNRLPGNGARGVVGADGYVYFVKGNGTFEFWRYSIADNTWDRLPDVPAGLSNKRVKNGTAMTWTAQYGTGYVYVLKGPRNDFMRYDTEAGAWENLAPAPVGQSQKWSSGSWLAFGGGPAIFAHKPKKNELWTYDLVNDAWDVASLPGMPLLGVGSQVRKARDGSAGAWKGGGLYALKGNKTGEFWQYSPALNGWSELEPMPVTGSTGRVAGVYRGGDLVSYPFGRTFFALKGNKTLEFWRYTMAPEGHGDALNPQPGAQAGPAGPARAAALVVSSNPPLGGFAQLSYALPQRGAARVRVYDAAGRVALSRSLQLETNGVVPLDIRGLSAGAYLVRLEAGVASAAHKFVVSR